MVGWCGVVCDLGAVALEYGGVVWCSVVCDLCTVVCEYGGVVWYRYVIYVL